MMRRFFCSLEEDAEVFAPAIGAGVELGGGFRFPPFPFSLFTAVQTATFHFLFLLGRRGNW